MVLGPLNTQEAFACHPASLVTGCSCTVQVAVCGLQTMSEGDVNKASNGPIYVCGTAVARTTESEAGAVAKPPLRHAPVNHRHNIDRCCKERVWWPLVHATRCKEKSSEGGGGTVACGALPGQTSNLVRCC